MTSAQPTKTSPVTRVELDPRSLLVDVNIRTDARLDKDFIASIKDLGVLVPITTVRTTAVTSACASVTGARLLIEAGLLQCPSRSSVMKQPTTPRRSSES
jgi:ParB family chromosome partitioning protein